MIEIQKIIHERLQSAFQPEFLEILDDSDKHKGHAGSENGAGHYTVKIKSSHFSSQSRVAIHRSIYKVLDDLIPTKIHALRIKLI